MLWALCDTDWYIRFIRSVWARIHANSWLYQPVQQILPVQWISFCWYCHHFSCKSKRSGSSPVYALFVFLNLFYIYMCVQSARFAALWGIEGSGQTTVVWGIWSIPTQGPACLRATNAGKTDTTNSLPRGHSQSVSIWVCYDFIQSDHGCSRHLHFHCPPSLSDPYVQIMTEALML